MGPTKKETGSHDANILAQVLSALSSPARWRELHGRGAGAGAHGRANFSAPIQTATKSHGLTNFLVWLVLAVIQTDPMCCEC